VRVRAEHELVQDQVIPDFVEAWERHVARDDASKMIVLLVQPQKNVEDEVAVKDDATEVGLGVDHALHLAIVVAHREVASDKVVKHGVEVKRARFTVADELVLDRALVSTCGDAVLLSDILKLPDDCAEDPGEGDGLHAVRASVIDRRSVGEDMVDEFVALQGEQNLIMPTGVAYR
jgi:hypothetical protein